MKLKKIKTTSKPKKTVDKIERFLKKWKKIFTRGDGTLWADDPPYILAETDNRIAEMLTPLLTNKDIKTEKISKNSNKPRWERKYAVFNLKKIREIIDLLSETDNRVIITIGEGKPTEIIGWNSDIKIMIAPVMPNDEKYEKLKKQIKRENEKNTT